MLTDSLAGVDRVGLAGVDERDQQCEGDFGGALSRAPARRNVGDLRLGAPIAALSGVNLWWRLASHCLLSRGWIH
jgi:hypothetical protein